MKETYFITGNGTDVGKTIVSAIVTEILHADYWKPIQAGDLANSDTNKVKQLVSNTKSKFHDSAFNLKTPMSPHAAAKIDGVEIQLSSIQRPTTSNTLVIEGAGGLLVPLNTTETVLDLINLNDKIVVVSGHYLGSINHTLLTIEVLKLRGFEIFGIIFNGVENSETEEVIKKMSGVPILGRVDIEPYFDKNVVMEYAEKFRNDAFRKR
ncbi:dethiobiotin synthetase [Ulvibacter sp. MAR_2010_11]|uniref:dethiobiotin synthase n=1 Tax=Ulvibacter sp. MAR_2010_11 TaxID=1250229 RepID=UPI000C2C18D8|nr:dethiobiotin synthase [Ulvibacter sp. MAR_2010_11]PKA82718.1 dethiobiotin synthetase [Ulvibacter sp. MAR_2010_11]